jgi:hypothetical protein
VDDSELDEIVSYTLGFCPDYPARIDWEDMLDRIEVAFDIDLGSDLLSTEIQQIKRAVQVARREVAS